ncbi:cobaltochelatase subunit CobN [Lichenicoccus sp.]|uniref:cobaltochelatase subunit CobN n=1 Tax=Lichenicoccus sp. TaxID=2781899 RepID=UPI003D0D6BDF
MHLLVHETRTLDAAEAACDPGLSPADLLFLSFSDSDLGAWAAAWNDILPSLRLANLARLRHPMSVDLLVEQVVAAARCVVIRLLGGLEYWRYGVEEVAAVCRAQGIALAVLPGDGPDDPRLASLSTIDPTYRARLDGFLRQGGPSNAAHALALAAHLAGLNPDDGAEPDILPAAGDFPLPGLNAPDRPLAVIVFYRSHLLCGDTEPITALATALFEHGLSVRALFASSLKDPDARDCVLDRLRAWRPAVVLSATAFSAPGLEAAGAPVLQLALVVGGRDAWAASARGLSQTDLAMQVVLPELDGRLLTTAISFKAADVPAATLQFARIINRADPDGIALAADRAAGWARLAAAPRETRRIAIVLSDYPGLGGQIAHAVGLDSLASLHAILGRLREAGYDTPPPPDELADALCHAPPTPFLTRADYARLRRNLPAALNQSLDAHWGTPPADFSLRHLRLGNVVVAVQPNRALPDHDRRAAYHDPDTPPSHAFVAFHLWLCHAFKADAVVHLGTHGSLEWLPGKAAALSAECWPVAMLRGMPVIYPFIVNNPGEAAVAKRRLGAVTIGHLTPPMRAAGGVAGELDRMIDDYAAADGLDTRRTAMLRGGILARAGDLGLLAESGADTADNDTDALARLDAWLCDVKDLQIREGLHVFGEPPCDRAALADTIRAASPNATGIEHALDACATAESQALLDALDGRFVAPGPAGAPSRGRVDVLPTGRNLFALDPRAVPTRAAMTLAAGMAEALLERHRQEHGDWLRSLVIDLWGSTSLRTGGEDFALALILIGATPLWDESSGRMSGVEILPTALLDRPRVDVTLRISGLFRDTFESQITLFDAAVSAIAARVESPTLNPLAASGEASPCRIYGPAPGAHGAGGAALLTAADRAALGRAYLDASAAGYGSGRNGTADPEGFAARVAASDALLHLQDHAETDLLDSPDYAAHEGGFAAAAALLGATPTLYHADSSRPTSPKLRLVHEEVARIVRGRLANPVWIAGMRRHGYRGAAEIARGLTALHAFARTLPNRFDIQYDLVLAATLGDSTTDDFLARANPEARRAMQADFRDALTRNLWQPKTNSARELLAEQ